MSLRLGEKELLVGVVPVGHHQLLAGVAVTAPGLPGGARIEASVSVDGVIVVAIKHMQELTVPRVDQLHELGDLAVLQGGRGELIDHLTKHVHHRDVACVAHRPQIRLLTLLTL